MDEPFCMVVPSLFALTFSKEVWVVDVWADLGGEGRGRAIGIYVLVDMNDWELDHIKASLLRLNGRSMKREEKDKSDMDEF